jgi:DNA-directed RNA polymerase subunit K/omega
VKKQNAQPILEPRSLRDLSARTSNLYESIAIISKRANQIASHVKEELHSKLEEFATHTDNLEEVHENREQIEISKHYEKLPNPALMAAQEFMDDKIYFRNPAREENPEATTTNNTELN